MLIFIVVAILFAVSATCFWLVSRAENIVLKVTLGLVGGCAALLFLFLFALGIFFGIKEPPSISTLEKHFTERHSTLEQILAMSDQDKYFFRIDPTFLDYDYTQGKMDGKAVVGEEAAKMSDARLKTYRDLFAKANLSQGFVRDLDGNVYFMAGSVGILNRGHTTGYLFCREPGSAASERSGYPACMTATKTTDSQTYSNNPRREAYSYKKIADHWYVLDEGPS
jgi:hypothetical protein